MIDFQQVISDKFCNIEFNEEKHIYKVKGEEYISATTLLKSFVPEFNTEEVAEKVSKKTGVSKEELIEQWKLDGKNGREVGTALHKYIENNLNDLPISLEEKPFIDSNLELFHQKIFQFEEFQKDHLTGKVIVGCEIIIYDEDYKLAGTIDCLIYDPVKNILWFIDWKSNKKISESNKWSNMLSPLQKYENSDLIKYSLQLSVYKYIVEKNVLSLLPNMSNVINNSINVIVSFPKDEESYKLYYTSYLKYSIQQLLNIRQKQIN